MRQFSSWFPLTEEGIERAPEGPAALHVRREEGLVDYPGGKSAMVYYTFAESDARSVLRDTFEREIQTPGARGEGPLLFRYLEGDERAREIALERLFKFIRKFDESPRFNEEMPDVSDGPSG